jgi:CsoR family transcriptional regulator, copper-sensing transcriptional repressor
VLRRGLRLRVAAMATAAGVPATRDQLLVRLRRAEGQLRGVQRMVEAEADCQEVLTQLSAVKAALDQVGLHLISERMRSCLQVGDEGCEAAFETAVATLLRYATLAR